MYVTGYHAIEESLRQGGGQTLLVCRANRRIQLLLTRAREAGVPVRRVEAEELDQLCGAKHQGAALQLREPAGAAGQGGASGPQKSTGGLARLREALAGLSGPDLLVLFLDQLQDPQNLGAVLRSADQLCVQLVVTTVRRSASETQAVLRSSAGASAYASVLPVGNLVQAIGLCQQAGFWIYGADIGGQRLDQLRFQGRIGLVMGSEGTGLRRLVRERCDELVRIPAGGHVDSFNVSAAASILMYEVRRQQGFPGFP